MEDMIYNLIENANGNIEKAQNGIIVIDEIDKKAGNEEHDVAGTEVLKSLLKIIERTIMQLPSLDESFSEELINFDTKNFIIIFLGAFSGLDIDTGARELSNTVNYMFENIVYDILANPNKFKKCTLNLDIVNDNTKYELS